MTISMRPNLSSISLKIVIFWWTDGKTAIWNVATWLNQEPQFFWTPLIVKQNHWQYKTRDSIVFNGKTLSQIAKVEYFRLRLPYINTTLNFVAISSGFFFFGVKKITNDLSIKLHTILFWDMCIFIPWKTEIRHH